MKAGLLTVSDPELKTYVTVHLPMVMSTFFESTQISALLKIQVGASREKHAAASIAELCC